jgi:hypothetical protein
VVRNPVRAGLCAEAADWEWSSFAGTLGGATPSFIDDRRITGLFTDLGELRALVNESR